MKKQIWTSLVAALVIAAGSTRLATPAHASSARFCPFTLGDLIAVSDALCGGGSWSATDISCDDTTLSWTLTCN
ncbi:MAG TPA: hypothetical protein VF771_03840 [Longimicrobiaceae bacterium]